MNTWYKFYIYSINLGLRYYLSGNFRVSKEALKRIIIPMDIARYFEIPATFQHINPKVDESILDISSPKLLSFYISERYKSNVYATDVWNKEILEWKNIKNNLGNSTLSKRLKLLTVDGTKLPFRNNFFDKIYSISVIEHIESHGDTICIKEMCRVLKPGGKIVITTPFGKEYKEIWVKRDAYGNKYDGDKPVFLSRIYSPKTLKERLLIPTGLKLEAKLICNERFPIITNIYTFFLPVSAFFGLLFPIFAKLTLRISKKIDTKNNVLFVLRKNKNGKG